MCPLGQPAHTALKITARFSLDEPHRQLFYLPCLNTGSMRCGIFVAADFVIKNGSQLEAIAALVPEVKHQVSLFQISCCSSCFGQVPPFITITSQNGQNVVLCYGVGNVKYAALCRGTCKKTSQCQPCWTFTLLSSICTSLEISIDRYPACSCHDRRIIHNTCFGNNSASMRQHF